MRTEQDVQTEHRHYVSEFGTALYPDVLQPIEAESTYELATLAGVRFAYDTGGRLLADVAASSAQACQSACSGYPHGSCRGVFFENDTHRCQLVNDTAASVATGLNGQSYRRLESGMMTSADVTRSLWIALVVPEDAAPGTYSGSLTVTTIRNRQPGRIVVPITLTVWPIESSCLQEQIRQFPIAFGFDHAVIPASAVELNQG